MGSENKKIYKLSLILILLVAAGIGGMVVKKKKDKNKAKRMLLDSELEKERQIQSIEKQKEEDARKFPSRFDSRLKEIDDKRKKEEKDLPDLPNIDSDSKIQSQQEKIQEWYNQNCDLDTKGKWFSGLPCGWGFGRYSVPYVGNTGVSTTDVALGAGAGAAGVGAAGAAAALVGATGGLALPVVAAAGAGAGAVMGAGASSYDQTFCCDKPLEDLKKIM